MASVLGIKAIQPCPNGELRIVYDLSLGRAATLAIYSDAVKRRLVGAEVGSAGVRQASVTGWS